MAAPSTSTAFDSFKIPHWSTQSDTGLTKCLFLLALFLPQLSVLEYYCTPEHGIFSARWDHPPAATQAQLDAFAAQIGPVPVAIAPLGPNDPVTAAALGTYQILVAATTEAIRINYYNRQIESRLITTILSSFDEQTKNALFPTTASLMAANPNSIKTRLRELYGTPTHEDYAYLEDKLQILIPAPTRDALIILIAAQQGVHHLYECVGAALDELKKVQYLRRAILLSSYAPVFHTALQYYDVTNPNVPAQTFEALATALKTTIFPTVATTDMAYANAATEPTIRRERSNGPPNPPPNHRNRSAGGSGRQRDPNRCINPNHNTGGHTSEECWDPETRKLLANPQRAPQPTRNYRR